MKGIRMFRFSNNRWLAHRQVKKVLKDGYFVLLDEKGKICYTIARKEFDWIKRSGYYVLDDVIPVLFKDDSADYRVIKIREVQFKHDKLGIIKSSPLEFDCTPNIGEFRLKLNYKLKLR